MTYEAIVYIVEIVILILASINLGIVTLIIFDLYQEQKTERRKKP